MSEGRRKREKGEGQQTGERGRWERGREKRGENATWKIRHREWTEGEKDETKVGKEKREEEKRRNMWVGGGGEESEAQLPIDLQKV